MSFEDVAYHRQREQQCREMAQIAASPDARRRHEELALLHARKAGVVPQPAARQ